MRLLRPRGDAPYSGRSSAPTLAAAPPARRCAPASITGRPPVVGCSARAEMRPDEEECEEDGVGLLRPRGDAPCSRAEMPPPPQAAPPARRCAPRRSLRALARRGCSARAEMRPVPTASSTTATWLLRPRGDAPSSRPSGCAGDAAAPPARRCALQGRCAAEDGLGCSARAEMRPRPVLRAARRGRLLRPRGDAPDDARAMSGLFGAAPPARRCARVEASRRFPWLGCSARAEMRRSRSGSATRRAWLLRPRGDAPRRRLDVSIGKKAAPPARRCAPEGLALSVTGQGCSARAEMRPTGRSRWARPSGLLRPRGDAPAPTERDLQVQ